MDYRELLAKYMCYVWEYEGPSFLKYAESSFSGEEFAELEEIEFVARHMEVLNKES